VQRAMRRIAPYMLAYGTVKELKMRGANRTTSNAAGIEAVTNEHGYGLALVELPGLDALDG